MPPILRTARLLAGGFSLLTSLVASAQTIVSGPTISGTWSPSGNPYIVSGSVTIPSGQTLLIQPGVVVWIGSGVSITNNGLIQAAGTPNDRIEFQAPVSSQYWGSILNNYSGPTNLFTFCDFLDADTALSMTISGVNGTMVTEILNCSFSNCISQAIFGQAQGASFGCNGAANPVNNPVIENCTFMTMSNGCVIIIAGGERVCEYNGGGYDEYGYGNAYPTLTGDIFQNLSGTAFSMQAGSYGGGSTAVFVNNTVVDCQGGVNGVDPWNAQVEDNIFVGCTNAIVDTGTLSRQVQFNDFYNNLTNFIGYASTYGQWIIPNRNETLADILYNISQSPQFISANDFQLQSTSPCVNAGEPGEAFANMCSPPSIGTNYDDMGAYGGPYACNWLNTVPKMPAQLSLSASNHLLSLNFAAIPRSTYQIKYVGTNLDATAGTNLWLTNSVLTPASAPVSIVVSPYPPTNKQSYYQVRSLGRSPGN